MSVEATTWAWSQECTPMEKLILVLLADHMNAGTGRLNPGVKRLTERSGMTRQGVFNQIKKLETRGLLRVERLSGAVNNYSLPVNAVDQSTPLTRQRHGLPPVNAVDYHPSTPLTTPVNAVDPNRKEPEVKPEIEPEVKPPAATEPPKIKNVPQTKYNPLDIELPATLNHASFREAWSDFVQHRKEIKKPLTAMAVKKSLKQMASWGLTASLVAIDKSCRNGYQGLFAPDKREMAQEPMKAANHPALLKPLDPEGWREWCEAKGYPYMEYAFGRGYMKDEFNAEKRR